MKGLLSCSPSPVLGSSWNQTRSFLFSNYMFGGFAMAKSTGGMKERTMPVLWRNCSLSFVSLQELFVWEENSCCLSPLSLDVMCSVGLLPCPSAALFDREHPYNSLHLLTCRAAGCPLCTGRGFWEGKWGRSKSVSSSFPSWRSLSLLQGSQASFRSVRSRIHGHCNGRCHWWVFSLSCGQGWHLWQCSLWNLEHTTRYQAD